MGTVRPWSALPRYTLALWLAACWCFLSQQQGMAAAPVKMTPILSEQMISSVVKGRDTTCYVYAMDGPTTKAAVYWDAPKLYVRLEPCTGLPHMEVSVYGCPSAGHQVNWEFQNQLMRNDLRSMGRRVPPAWEWPGDLETLRY